MNQKAAKALRREIYGDTSLRIERDYSTGTRWLRFDWKSPLRQVAGTRRNVPESPRARYQAAKRRIRARRAGGGR